MYRRAFPMDGPDKTGCSSALFRTPAGQGADHGECPIACQLRGLGRFFGLGRGLGSA
jgi:hypothetical protein